MPDKINTGDELCAGNRQYKEEGGLITMMLLFWILTAVSLVAGIILINIMYPKEKKG